MIFECMKCGHKAEPTIPEGEEPTRFEDGVWKCDECATFMAYGEIVTRVVVGLDATQRWVCFGVGDGVTFKLPKAVAMLLALNIRSVAEE